MTHTHTYVHLEVSRAAYEEIKYRLAACGWEHAILNTDRSDDEVLDMNGIALVREPLARSTVDPASKKETDQE